MLVCLHHPPKVRPDGPADRRGRLHLYERYPLRLPAPSPEGKTRRPHLWLGVCSPEQAFYRYGQTTVCNLNLSVPAVGKRQNHEYAGVLDEVLLLGSAGSSAKNILAPSG